MKNFEEELKRTMNEETEMSGLVRERLDQVYDGIRKDGKTRRKSNWIPGVAAAAVIALCVVTLSNEKVQASLKTLFGGSAAVQIAEEHNFFNDTDEKASDQGITLQLTKVFADTGQIGFQINGQVEEPQLLSGVENIYFEYYIKNEDGDYVIDSLGDEKYPVKSSNPYEISSSNETVVSCDDESGTFTLQAILESPRGLIPDLDHSQIEIVAVRFAEASGETSVSVEGQWVMPFHPDSETKAVEPVVYQVDEVTGDIRDLTAEADATGLRIAFSCDRDSEALELLRIIVIDSEGKEYAPVSYSLDDENKSVNAVLPYSAFQEERRLRLVITGGSEGEQIGEAVLSY